LVAELSAKGRKRKHRRWALACSQAHRVVTANLRRMQMLETARADLAAAPDDAVPKCERCGKPNRKMGLVGHVNRYCSRACIARARNARVRVWMKGKRQEERTEGTMDNETLVKCAEDVVRAGTLLSQRLDRLTERLQALELALVKWSREEAEDETHELPTYHHEWHEDKSVKGDGHRLVWRCSLCRSGVVSESKPGSPGCRGEQ